MGQGLEVPHKFHQRRPVLFGLIILAGLFLVFVVVIAVLGKSLRPQASGARAGGFGFGSKVAVLKVEGVIMDSEPLLKELRNFRDDNSIKAVVLRVDSPGGSVAPSQEIYEEIRRFNKEKPVVASMASVAASGGFYVCLPCSYIYASPGTVTGSIGVIMESLNVGELLKWAKVKEEVIKSGKFKDAGNPTRDMTDEERAYFQEVIQNVHGQFKAAVMESRKLTPEQVEAVADGRIFTGEQAKKLGLIDGLGNLEDAIKKAGELGGIKGEPEVLWPRRKYSWFEDLGSEAAHNVLNQVIVPLSNPIWYLESGGLFSTQRSEP